MDFEIRLVARMIDAVIAHEAGHHNNTLLLNAPTAALLSFLLLGERLSGVQLIGGACVLLAIAAASGLLSRQRHQANGGPT